jgi:hypothetical protein
MATDTTVVERLDHADAYRAATRVGERHPYSKSVEESSRPVN